MQSDSFRKQYIKDTNEAHYRHLFECIKSGVAVYEAIKEGNDFIVKDFNGAGEIIDNVKRDDVIGKYVSEVFPGVNETGLLRMYREVWMTGKNMHHPSVYVKDRDHASWREYDIYKLPTGEVVSVYNDITGRIIAEQKSQQTKIRYKALLNSTFDAIDSLIMVVDKDLRVVLSNWKNNEWVPEKLRQKQPYCYKAMKNYQSPCENCPPLKTFTDGKTRWFLDQNPVDGSYKEISVIPIFDGDGHVEYVLENVKDVTERVKRQRILESKNEELEQFAYTVSHDLKSPLVTIKGFIGLLQQDTQSQKQDKMERYINHIENASDKMIGLLDDLLQLSRAGRSVKSSETINMESLAHEVIEILDGAIQKTKANIVVNPGMPEVFGDKTRIRQVLQNLVENSLKYMGEQNEPLIEIGSREHENDKFILFFVKDNGIGIEPEYHEKVFGVFDQLINDKGGSGIGLSIVKKIIELHHGSIWVESSGGKGLGTTFWFTLPTN